MKLRHLLIYSLTALSFSGLANTKADSGLPPVLSYYPDCEYEIVEKTKVSNSSVQPLSRKNKLKVINKLRQEAQDAGANAVIITKLTVDKPSKANLNDSFRKLHMSAELIKNCAPNDRVTKNLTRYNEEGRRLSGSWNSNLSLQFKLTLPAKPKFARPAITSNLLSMSDGIYGAKLGASFDEVKQLLGDPTIELNLYEEQVVLGYGRRHWFYFMQDKLIRVQTSDLVLNQAVLNEAPYWDFFDHHKWQIEGKIAQGASLKDVKEALNIEDKLTKSEQLSFKQDNAELILHFSYEKDFETKQKLYNLDYFDYRIANYQEPVVRDMSEVQDQLAQVTRAFSKLQSNVELENDDFDLSSVLGVIWLSPTEKLQIYNDNLLLKVNKKQVKEIRLMESLFQQQLLTQSPWFLGNFGVGKSMAELRPHFGEDALELTLDVYIDSDDYELKLAFDDSQGEPELYEAKLKIY